MNLENQKDHLKELVSQLQNLNSKTATLMSKLYDESHLIGGDKINKDVPTPAQPKGLIPEIDELLSKLQSSINAQHNYFHQIENKLIADRTEAPPINYDFRLDVPKEWKGTL